MTKNRKKVITMNEKQQIRLRDIIRAGMHMHKDSGISLVRGLWWAVELAWLYRLTAGAEIDGELPAVFR